MEKVIPRDEYETLLKQLVQIQSPYFHEDDVMAFVCDWFEKKGVPAEIHTFYEPKETDFHGKNVVGIMDSGRPGPVIYLGGHLDTVQLCNGWTKPPYEGVTEDGYMYGVGALDMKSGCAAIMLAVAKFAKEHQANGSFCGKLIYHLVSDEEGPYGLGTVFIINDNIHNVAKEADFAIIAEPSAGFAKVPHPCVCLGARGGYNYTIKVYGKSAHAATPELGINAMVDASLIVGELEKIPPETDEKLGSSSPCVIAMHGGGAACSVPDYAEVEIFHHTVRGETKKTIKDRVDKAIKAANVRSRVEVVFRQSPAEGFDGGFDAYCIDENGEYLKKLESTIEKVCGKPANTAYFQSIGDFNHIGGKLGIPTVLFGADGDNFHSSDERVNLTSGWEVALSINEFISDVLCNQEGKNEC
ncbi:MAG TPA: M20/M25/M40 family metallo-hydrolase [Candidatus Fimisoma avicola]|uniref:M20/M25/M40 family metallo-hydrolase n=1 Tax=Candidatus Fimisoma avicola TaxID=2840826 RepID=A0A9D1I2H1_9FIRM|nr:M20/M25/M40 family metallo-hydrolase [Candidatus Fimisoma avicola]